MNGSDNKYLKESYLNDKHNKMSTSKKKEIL
jgi:hypothetical protein